MEREDTRAVETASVADPLIGTHVGEYRVEEKVGEGGMASVYSAVHPLIGKRAAIKVMTPFLSADANAVVRFIQEARAVNQIGHPNIVDVFSFGRLPDGRSYFVMEHLQGESLFERLCKRRLSLAECLEIIDQVADALEAAHDKGIIHRDIKPANIFLLERRGSHGEQVKLLDFGVAKLQAREMNMTHTRTGFVVGTPDYISPEQARARDVDQRTDIYALGVVLYEMVLGELPFIADNPMDVVRQHMTEAPPVPSAKWPQIPPLLDKLILDMLQKEPEQRPSLSELRAAISHLRGTAMATGILPRRRKRLDARRVQMFTGGAFLTVGLLILAWSALHIAPDAVPSLMPSAKAQERGGAQAVVQARPETRPIVTEPAAQPAKKVSRARKKHLAVAHDGDYLVDPFGP